MDAKLELLQQWLRSVSVMHIAHHVAASGYAKWHRWFGCIVAGMTALVGTSVFVSLQMETNICIKIATGFVSIVASTLTGIHTFLSLDKRATKHTSAVADFQGLRREIEEEIVLLQEGKKSENFRNIREKWCETLNTSPPLPQRIHDKVKSEMNSKHTEK